MPGQKLVEIILNGYKTETTNVYLYKKEILYYQFKLKKLDVNLNIYLTPLDARIIIDGDKYFSQNKFKLSSGTHSFTFERDGYNTQQKWLHLKTGEKNIEISLSRKTTTGAFLRSMILPGWGQHYQDKHKKEKIFPVLFTATSVGTFLAIKYYNKSIADYNSTVFNYQNVFLETDVIKYSNKMEDDYNKVETAQTIRDIFIVSTAVVWLWNIIDTIVVPPEWHKDILISSNLVNERITTQISLSIK